MGGADRGSGWGERMGGADGGSGWGTGHHHKFATPSLIPLDDLGAMVPEVKLHCLSVLLDQAISTASLHKAFVKTMVHAVNFFLENWIS